MTFDTGFQAQSSQTGVLDSRADEVIARARRGTSPAAATTQSSITKEDGKIEKAGKDFESILLGSWLQQAEQSFAKVPGGDGESDDDASKDQFQGIAMQALAGSLTASGGIGIAKMITKHLHAAGKDAIASDPAPEASTKII